MLDVNLLSAMRIDDLKILLRRGLLAVSVATLAVASVPVLAQGAYTPPSQARRLAIGVCGTCHGVSGNSKNPMFPRLAGQKAWYLEQQLKEFRDHTRGDAYAVGYMWGMANQLSNSTIVALAKYFSQQKAGPGTRRPAPVIAEGNQIYHQGIPTQGVPACAACHGPNGLGNAHFPRVAGQHAEYILKQLNAFRTNMRDVFIMHGITMTLHVKQEKAVADYLASLS
jgi:cytochrome c553